MKMAHLKETRKDPRCVKHDIPVEIFIPKDEFGNAHGERWRCEKCIDQPKNEPEKIKFRVW